VSGSSLSHDLNTWLDRRGRRESGDFLRLLDSIAGRLFGSELDRLSPEQLRVLLLEGCPQDLMVLEEEFSGVLCAAADLVGFLEDSGGVDPAVVPEYQEVLADVEPVFAERMHDQALWSPGKRVLGSFAGDDVDISDAEAQAALRRFSEDLPVALASAEEEEGDGIPLIAPVRLPPVAEMAATARRTPLTRRLLALAAWAEPGRVLDPGRSLLDGDDRELLGRLDDPWPAADGDAVSGLRTFWSLARGTCVLELDEEKPAVRPGHAASDISGDDDDLALGAWLHVTADLLMAWTDSVQADGRATAVLLHLFTRRAPASRAALAGLPDAGPPEALERDLVWLADAGLIEDRGLDVSATALGLYLARDMVEEATDLPVPVLGGYGDGSAAGFLRYVRAHDPDELAEELAGWLASRDAGSAAAEIAEVLGWVSPAARLRGMHLLMEHLDATGREALGSLRRDSRLAALAQMLLSGRDEHYETTPSRADVLWTLVDVGAAGLEVAGSSLDALVSLGARDAAPAALIDLLSGLGDAKHPWTGRVLATIADLHPDPQVVRIASAELRHYHGEDARPGARGRKPRKPKKAGKKAGARKKKRR
jgi:hypothetical protein